MAGPVVALCAAVASAATFGLSTSMQHLASSRIAGAPPHRLLMTLLRTPLWVLGMTLSVIAFALHALALSAGALVLVQPVIVTGVVFAVLIRAVLDRRAPSRAEVGWATVTWIGLAVFLIGTGSPAVAAGLPAHAGSAVAALVGAAALAAVAARRCREGSIGKGLWLGVVSGVLFGLVAVLLKLSLLTAAGGVTAVLSTWAPWVMVACGACAVLVNQRAYQTTRLSVSMPILNIVDVVVALLFAGVVFGETPALGPGALLTEAAGFVAMAIGVTKLARLEHEQEAPPAEELVLAPPSILELQETSR